MPQSINYHGQNYTLNEITGTYDLVPGSGSSGALGFSISEIATTKAFLFQSSKTLSNLNFIFDVATGNAATFTAKKVTAAQYAVGALSSTGTTLSTITVPAGAVYNATTGLAGVSFSAGDFLFLTLNSGTGFSAVNISVGVI